MAARKKGPAKNRKRSVSGKRKKLKKNKRLSVLNEFKKIFVGLAVLVAICLTVAMVADIFLKPGRIKPEKTTPTPQDDRIKPIREELVITREDKSKPTGLKEKAKKTITYEVFDDVEHIIVEKPVQPRKDKIPRVAVIIDDIGYDRKIALALFALNSDITFSVLPFSPFVRTIAEKLNAKGALLMLHLLMEPVE